MLGISDELNTVELAAKRIRECITKEYKNIIIHSESKHCAGGVSYALQLSDIVTHILLMAGPTTFDWDRSPWVQKYLKWAKRPEELKHQFLDMPDAQFMHIIKTYNYFLFCIKSKESRHGALACKDRFCLSKYEVEYYFFLRKSKWLEIPLIVRSSTNLSTSIPPCTSRRPATACRRPISSPSLSKKLTCITRCCSGRLWSSRLLKTKMPSPRRESSATIGW